MRYSNHAAAVVSTASIFFCTSKICAVVNAFPDRLHPSSTGSRSCSNNVRTHSTRACPSVPWPKTTWYSDDSMALKRAPSAPRSKVGLEALASARRAARASAAASMEMVPSAGKRDMKRWKSSGEKLWLSPVAKSWREREPSCSMTGLFCQLLAVGEVQGVGTYCRAC